MKAKLVKDEFETQCWCNRIVADPYQVLSEAFTTSDMVQLRRFIRMMLQYSESNRVYKKDSPGEVLINMRLIRSLIRAARKLKEKKKGPVEVLESDVLNKSFYCLNYLPEAEWDQFPRFVSMNEYCNPYKLFRKFFNCQTIDQWVYDWEKMVDCALSPYRGEQDLQLISFYIRLSKLVEAAHLIYLRDVNHLRGVFNKLPIEE